MNQNLPQSDHIVNHAIELGEAGVPVFPVGANKTPVWRKGESPNGRDGFHMASTDGEEIEALFDHPAVRGIGMPTGKISGCTVIDVDCGKGKKNREEAAKWLEGVRDTLLRGCSVVRTASGGLHYYCAWTEGLKNASSLWADGVDCRNDGGYVVVPPFMGYKWVRNVERDDWPRAPEVPPGRGRERIETQPHRGETPEGILERLRLIEEGVTWHDPAREIVAHLVGSGWSDAEIIRHAFSWTWPGHTLAETLDQVCVFITGAREKWEKREGRKVADTEEIRANKLVDIWNRCSVETRRAFLEAVRNG